MTRAIGLVHVGLSAEILRDHSWIERAARRHGYQLARILSIDFDTYMPTTLIVSAAAQARATVIITPDVDYLGIGYRAVPLACAVLAPTGLIGRRSERADPP
ncbi:hypothetical protein [Nocardia arizonensis]|uniref:hypothetical protein n=1 Tax=Nocardia arizonensis TaxID=1141647 RepID=UPI0006D245C1|nr:hypothetical protein [Nocardia arizonensis]